MGRSARGSFVEELRLPEGVSGLSQINSSDPPLRPQRKLSRPSGPESVKQVVTILSQHNRYIEFITPSTRSITIATLRMCFRCSTSRSEHFSSRILESRPRLDSERNFRHRGRGGVRSSYHWPRSPDISLQNQTVRLSCHVGDCSTERLALSLNSLKEPLMNARPKLRRSLARRICPILGVQDCWWPKWQTVNVLPGDMLMDTPLASSSSIMAKPRG